VISETRELLIISCCMGASINRNKKTVCYLYIPPEFHRSMSSAITYIDRSQST